MNKVSYCLLFLSNNFKSRDFYDDHSIHNQTICSGPESSYAGGKTPR